MKKLIVIFLSAILLFSCDKNIEISGEDPISLNLLKSVEISDGYSLFFEREQPFIRYDGKPVTLIEELDSPEGWEPCFQVHVISGDETGNHVSSAVVQIDDVEILNTSDFSNTNNQYTIEVCDLTEDSQLTVEIRGAPGSILKVWIE